MEIVHSVQTERTVSARMVTVHVTTIVSVRTVTDHSVRMEIVHVTTATVPSAQMVTVRQETVIVHREDMVTDRQDRKMVIEMAVIKEKTTIIKKASRVIAAVVIILEVIETIDRTIQAVRENREDA